MKPIGTEFRYDARGAENIYAYCVKNIEQGTLQKKTLRWILVAVSVRIYQLRKMINILSQDSHE
jgi:hypothetical protein